MKVFRGVIDQIPGEVNLVILLVNRMAGKFHRIRLQQGLTQHKGSKTPSLRIKINNEFS